MKIDWYKAASALQLIIGAAAIISFFVLAFGGENIKPWIITVILAVVLTVSGIIGLVSIGVQGVQTRLKRNVRFESK